MKATWGTKDTFHFITLRIHCVTMGVRRGTQARQHLKQKPGWSVAYWLALHVFLNLLLYFIWDHLTRSSTATPGPPSGSIITEMDYLLSHRSTLAVCFLKWDSFFPNDFSLCQHCQQDLNTSNLTHKHSII